MIDYLGPMYADKQMDAVSAQHHVLINICLHALKLKLPELRIIENRDAMMVFVQIKVGNDHETLGELPADIPILRRTRFVTNSKGISDNRLPIGDLTIQLPNQTLHIKVTKDESKPQNLLEFTVAEVKT